MANFNDNDLEDLGFEEEGKKPEEAQPEKKPGNRNFLIALLGIGIAFVLITAALIAVAVFILPGQNASRKQASLQTLAVNTATAQSATDQAAIIVPTASSTPVPSATKAISTNTPVVAPTQTKTKTVATLAATQAATLAATQAATVTTVPDSQKATLSAQQTQLAAGKFTATVIATSTALPNTGFADEVGLPALAGLAASLILVIFVARRLRSLPAR